MMLQIYKQSMRAGEGFIKSALLRRQKAGKESPERFNERFGVSHRDRPKGRLVWVHAASVGESQSALILIQTILRKHANLNVLVTTGTLTSAEIMEKNLPKGAFHQFYPVDHPDWVEQFLNHWQPDFVLWMESELWPNMLQAIGQRKTPLVLINARLSPQSFKRWRLFKGSAQKLLANFSQILCQTAIDAKFYETLGATNVQVTDNLKYNAKPLPASDEDLKTLSGVLGSRPCWVYASTHAGEETLAARVHTLLKASLPELLTIIAPRHPGRRDDIKKALEDNDLNVTFRGESKTLPDENADIYVSDTMGELGLLYRACPVAVIGRSFSDDGGGGHNPIEAAQLHCAVLHGPNVQNLQEIFDEMNKEAAATRCATENDLRQALHTLLSDTSQCQANQKKAFDFANDKQQVLGRVMDAITPYLDQLDIPGKISA